MFSSKCRFFLRDAQDRLLAPQNDELVELFRSLLNPASTALRAKAPHCVLFATHRSSLEAAGQHRKGQKRLSVFVLMNIVG